MAQNIRNSTPIPGPIDSEGRGHQEKILETESERAYDEDAEITTEVVVNWYSLKTNPNIAGLL